jgi:hypothetical protein
MLGLASVLDWSAMSEVGQTEKKLSVSKRLQGTLKADIAQSSQHVSKVPRRDIPTCSLSGQQHYWAFNSFVLLYDGRPEQ